mgnify:CR=1 FL=1
MEFPVEGIGLSKTNSKYGTGESNADESKAAFSSANSIPGQWNETDDSQLNLPGLREELKNLRVENDHRKADLVKHQNETKKLKKKYED